MCELVVPEVLAAVVPPVGAVGWRASAPVVAPPVPAPAAGELWPCCVAPWVTLRSAELERIGKLVSGVSVDVPEFPLVELVLVLVVGVEVGLSDPLVETALMGVLVAVEVAVLLAVLGIGETPRLKPVLVAGEVAADGTEVGTTPLVPLWPRPEQRPWHSGVVEPLPLEPGTWPAPVAALVPVPVVMPVVPVVVPVVPRPAALLGGLVGVVPVVVVVVVVVPVAPVVVVPVVVVPVVPVVVVPVVVAPLPVVVSVGLLPVPVGRFAVPPSVPAGVAGPGVASEVVLAGVVAAGAGSVVAVVVTVAAGVVAVVAGVVVVAAGALWVCGVTASKSCWGLRCASAAPASRASTRASRRWRAYEPSPAAAPPTPKIAHTSVTIRAIEHAPLLRLMIRVHSADRFMPGLRLPGSRLVSILGVTPAHSSYFDKCPRELEPSRQKTLRRSEP